MQIPKIFSLPLAALALVLCLIQPSQAQNTDSAESALAEVNGQIISVQQLHLEIGQLRAEMGLRNQLLSGQQIDSLRGQLIENLIDREILHQQALQNKIQVRSEWIDNALSDMKVQLGGTAGLQSYLSNSGMTQEQLRERLNKGLAVRQLLRKDPIRAIKVSEAETQAYYREHPDLFMRGEQVRVRHILIAAKTSSDDNQRNEAWEKIKALQKQLENGADFAVLALEYSDCPSRIQAGDLGYLTRDQMIASFAGAAFDLQPGATSDVVTTRFGYHLIKMIDRKPPSQMAYMDVREKIERTLRRDKENSTVDRYVKKLKSQAEIKRFGLKQ